MPGDHDVCPSPLQPHECHLENRALPQPAACSVLYGVSGFKHSVAVLVASAVPAVVVMCAALWHPWAATQQGAAVAIWAGLGTLMGLRGALIWAMLRLGRGPFRVLRGTPDE